MQLRKVDGVDISVPEVFLGGMAGATLVFYFSGQCMTAVGDLAWLQGGKRLHHPGPLFRHPKNASESQCPVDVRFKHGQIAIIFLNMVGIDSFRFGT